jgi:hypothetical protein
MTEEEIKAITDLDIAIHDYQARVVDLEVVKEALKNAYQVVFQENKE